MWRNISAQHRNIWRSVIGKHHGGATRPRHRRNRSVAAINGVWREKSGIVYQYHLNVCQRKQWQ